MKSFSQKNNLKPKRILQIDSIDRKLRVSIWNIIYFYIDLWKTWENHPGIIHPRYGVFIESLWTDFFGENIEFINELDLKMLLESLFFEDEFFGNKWYEIYDLMEFIIENEYFEETKANLTKEFNEVLKRENSAYRIINGLVTPIIDEFELKEIEECLDSSPKVVKNHINKSFELLYNRDNPDYANSAKEAILAVESQCNIILNRNTTLGQALNIIEKENNVIIPKELKSAFSSIYGYTSSASGIRHASIKDDEMDFETAQFLLISCSAFLNYLITLKDN